MVNITENFSAENGGGVLIISGAILLLTEFGFLIFNPIRYRFAQPETAKLEKVIYIFMLLMEAFAIICLAVLLIIRIVHVV